jgi:hypothetical protein
MPLPTAVPTTVAPAIAPVNNLDLYLNDLSVSHRSP